MKNAFFVLTAVLCAAVLVSGQESGNRIYGNQGYYNQQKRQPPLNNGNLMTTNSLGFQIYSVEASVLINLKPDAFVAVFGVNDEDKQAAASNAKVNARIDEFMKALNGLGIGKSDIYVDFITQSRVYDYTVQGRQATETFSGFETKKTVAIRYKSRDAFEKIVAAAAAQQIFDLIKVDYIVSDFESVRAKLFEEAAKIVKAKRDKYMTSFGIAKLDPIGLENEKYEAFYPSEQYQKYQAFETGDAYTSYENSSKVVQRKSFTFFYEPLPESKFDLAINKAGLEPVVQFTAYLRMNYDATQVKPK